MTWSQERAEEHLLSLELFGMRFGLERMLRLLTALGSPQERFAAVHVVGTNGKSSTVRMTAALLEAHGVRTGSYLSPHLVRFAERIRVGDDDLPGAAFGAAIQRAAAAAARVDRTLTGGERVTQFELLTAAALDELARREVEVAVVEAGLGGRWDATNVLTAGFAGGHRRRRGLRAHQRRPRAHALARADDPRHRTREARRGPSGRHARAGRRRWRRARPRGADRRANRACARAGRPAARLPAHELRGRRGRGDRPLRSSARRRGRRGRRPGERARPTAGRRAGPADDPRRRAQPVGDGRPGRRAARRGGRARRSSP